MTIVFGSPAAQRVLERDKALRGEWPDELLDCDNDPALMIRETYRRWRKRPADERDLEWGSRLRWVLLWCKRGQL